MGKPKLKLLVLCCLGKAIVIGIKKSKQFRSVQCRSTGQRNQIETKNSTSIICPTVSVSVDKIEPSRVFPTEIAVTMS